LIDSFERYPRYFALFIRKVKPFNGRTQSIKEPAMPILLQLNNSLFGDDGQSSDMANGFVDRLRAREPDVRIIHRDLGREPVPHLSAGTFTAALTPAAERSPDQAEAARLADTLLDELMQADTLVIASPMYNFSIPSTLKAWFDHVARAGTSFHYTESGPEGLLTHLKAYVFVASGGFYQGTELDFQTRYLQHLLGFLGIGDVEFTHLEGTTMGEEALNRGRQAAQARIETLVT
jgi:FMN-dependent NADH-azoreductase